MSGQNEENLKDLFEKFLNSEQTEQAVKDVRNGEQILREHPAPEPDNALVADIKAKISVSLRHRKTITFKHIAYRMATVAAVIIVLMAVSVKLFEKSSSEPKKLITASIIPSTIWESDDIAADDADLAILTAEIEEIESEVLAVQLSENGNNGSVYLDELETELMEIDSDFWKG